MDLANVLLDLRVAAICSGMPTKHKTMISTPVMYAITR